jgi:hypothetical protein
MVIPAIGPAVGDLSHPSPPSESMSLALRPFVAACAEVSRTLLCTPGVWTSWIAVGSARCRGAGMSLGAFISSSVQSIISTCSIRQEPRFSTGRMISINLRQSQHGRLAGLGRIVA